MAGARIPTRLKTNRDTERRQADGSSDGSGDERRVVLEELAKHVPHTLDELREMDKEDVVALLESLDAETVERIKTDVDRRADDDDPDGNAFDSQSNDGVFVDGYFTGRDGDRADRVTGDDDRRSSGNDTEDGVDELLDDSYGGR